MSSFAETDEIGNLAHLVGFLPYLEDAISKMEQALETRVYMQMDKGELTPDKAMYYWQEKLVLRRILRRFQQRTRAGQSLGERLQQQMEIE